MSLKKKKKSLFAMIFGPTKTFKYIFFFKKTRKKGDVILPVLVCGSNSVTTQECGCLDIESAPAAAPEPARH